MIFDLNTIKQELDDAEIEQDEEGKNIQRTYLGSVNILYPSGKFYTPWDHSNLEICDNCNASGMNSSCNEITPCIPSKSKIDDHDEGNQYHCEACKDMAWLEEASNELETIGAVLANDTDDPTDMYALRTVNDLGTIQ